MSNGRGGSRGCNGRPQAARLEAKTKKAGNRAVKKPKKIVIV
ncbi:MAG: hypothetical protein WCQ00_03440 [bacterium]